MKSRPTRDLAVAFWTGAASGVLWFFALYNLSLFSVAELAAIAIALPLLCVLAVAAAKSIFTGRTFHMLARFFIVGILNTGVDFFVFNMLITVTGNGKGLWIAGFKSLGFIMALVNSYELNRRWTFAEESAGVRTRREFIRFTAVTVVGFLLNVGATFLIADKATPLAGLTQIRWDDVAAVIATALNLIWNFIGYKLFVFTSLEPDVV